MTGQDDSKFGFGLASGAAAGSRGPAAATGSPVELVGLHAHIGSQIFTLDSFEKAMAALAEFFSPLGLAELCIGGGLGVAYVAGEAAPSITRMGGRAVRRGRGGRHRARGAPHRRAGPGDRRRAPPSPATRSAPSRKSRACAPTSASTAA